MSEPLSNAAEETSVAMRRWGWGLSGLVILFLLMDSGMKLADLAPVQTAETRIGWPLYLDRPLGLISLVGALLYAYPRTAVLGAIYLTGHFGGAIAAHLRLGDPLFSHVLFGVYMGLLMWGGLWLRDGRLRRLMPFSG